MPNETDCKGLKIHAPGALYVELDYINTGYNTRDAISACDEANRKLLSDLKTASTEKRKVILRITGPGAGFATISVK